MKILSNNKFNILLLFILWVVIIIIINPTGNFPFGDDFAYGRPVKHFLETGQIRITDWSSMTLVAHIYIGVIVTKIFGFSFTVLRITTLFFGFIGMVGTYFLSLELSNNKKISLLGAFLIGFNPSFYLISYSYATDISFFAFAILSILFYIKFLNKTKVYFIIFAIIFNLIAMLIRELAIILPPAFALAYIYKNGIKIKKLIVAIIPVLLIIVEYLIYRYWLVNIHGLTKSMDYSRNVMFKVWTSGAVYFLKTYTKNVIYANLFLGFYLFPAIFIFYFVQFKNYIKKALYFQFVMIFGLGGFIIFLLRKSPVTIENLGHFLTEHHFFHTFWLGDVHNPSQDYIFYEPHWLLVIIIIIAVLGVFSLWSIGYFRFRNYIANHTWNFLTRRNGISEMLILIIILYLIPILTQITMVQIFLFAVAHTFYAINQWSGNKNK